VLRAPDCIIITCFGRWKYLAKTLPLTLERTTAHVFVVSSWQCPDGTLERLRKEFEPLGRVRGITTAFDEVEGHVVFNKPRAVNAAIYMCFGNGYRVALLMDADTIIHPAAFAQLSIEDNGDSGEFAYVRPSLAMRDLTGILVARLRLLTQVGGLDERMSGWGAEDIDLRLALYCEKEKQKVVSDGLFVAVAHDDELRGRHYANKNIYDSLQRNIDQMLQNYYRRTGRRLEKDYKNGEFLQLLGYAPIMEAFGVDPNPTAP